MYIRTNPARRAYMPLILNTEIFERNERRAQHYDGEGIEKWIQVQACCSDRLYIGIVSWYCYNSIQFSLLTN